MSKLNLKTVFVKILLIVFCLQENLLNSTRYPFLRRIFSKYCTLIISFKINIYRNCLNINQLRFQLRDEKLKKKIIIHVKSDYVTWENEIFDCTIRTAVIR